ncbi:MAG: hypothetical protein LBV26_06020 [Bacteroidales bacterium]|jgi:hypothetical protein|nr:hypothetical protein [Bacteroidales bacterium]
MKYSDWMPSKRHERIDMALNWASYLKANMVKFNIPETEVNILAAMLDAVVADTSIPKHDRTAVVNARIGSNMKSLAAAMRNIKKRYFFIPPLAGKDMVALGLKPGDDTLSVIAAPMVQAAGELWFPARSMVAIRNIHPLDNRKTGASEHGVRIYYGIMGASAECDRFSLAKRPVIGEELPHSLFTRRRAHRFQFTGMSGCEVFFCLRYENTKGEAGPWGTVMSTFIP